jgi:hypothetical protein
MISHAWTIPAGRRRSFLTIPVDSPFGGIELRMIEAYIKTTGEPVPTSVGVFYIAFGTCRFGARLVLCEENLVFGTIPQLPRQREER